MAKKSPNLDMPEITPSQPAKKPDKAKNSKNNNKKDNKKPRKSLGKFFRDIISELKKVEWAKMKKTKNNSGVLAQTGTVLVVVLFFMVVVALFDMGFTELISILLKAGA